MLKILAPLAALAALAVCAACTDVAPPSPAAAPENSVAVAIRRMGIDRRSDAPVLLLEEIDGERVLPIWIGSSEAHSIQGAIDAVEWPRPNTHDLAKQMLVGLDATIERVTVTELRDDTYYAVVRVLAESEAREFDARPSDAIAMALRFDAPVFVDGALFDEHAGIRGDAADPADSAEDSIDDWPRDSAEPSDKIRL